MTKRLLVALPILAALGGCQTAQQPDMVWVRTDKKRMDGNAALQQQYQIDATICKGDTLKTAVGMAPIYYQGLGGAIGAAMIQNQRSEALLQVAEGCMAQRGYLRMTREQALAFAGQSVESPARKAASGSKRAAH